MRVTREHNSGRPGSVFGYDDSWDKSYSRFRQQFEALAQLIQLENDVLAAGERQCC